MARTALLALWSSLVLLAFAASPALAQSSIVGTWVSDDGAITFELTVENTYILSGDLAVDEERLTGRFAVPGDGSEILARANERQGAMRFSIVELDNANLVLVSDEVLGGSVSFTRPSLLVVATNRALSGYALFWLVIMVGGAVMTGQALGRTWQPLWKTVPYAILIGLANICPSLFDGRLIHILDTVVLFSIHTPILFVAVLIAYLATRARHMVAQYPWRYRRAGIFGWREKGGQA